MPTFKDFIPLDNNRVFINTNEFAEIHNIDGEDLPIVFDTDILNERPLQHAEGVYLSHVVIFIDKKALGYIPVQNQEITVDDVIYTVMKVSDDNGLLEITLEANES